MPSETAAEARLREVPWVALQGLGPTLAPALDAILAGKAADTVLDRLLREHRDFTREQRRVCAEACFGVGLWRRRLQAQLGLTAASSLQLLASLARDLGGAADAATWLGVELPAPRPPPEAWPERSSVPEWLAEVLTAAVADEAPRLADALNIPGPVCLRANRLLATPAQVAERLAHEGVSTHPGRWAEDCLVVDTPRPNLSALQAFREGQFEVQDEGSQLLGQVLPLAPGDTVLDLCAGAGGKTLQLASRLRGQGTVHASDVDLARLERLRVRAQRARATVAIHPRVPPAELRVQAVLVDAPCSELGALRRGPDVRWRLAPSSFAAWPPLQSELLERGWASLAPGGHLAYATCTLRREENEDVVEAFLHRHAEAQLVRPALAAESFDDRGFVKTFPHRHGTDGFFAALLRRSR